MLIGFVSAIVAVLVDNMASLNLRTVPVAVTFWMILGMSVGFFEMKERMVRFSISRHLKILRFLPDVVFAIILFWYLPKSFDRYVAEKNFLQGDMLRWQERTAESSIKFETVVAHDSSHGEALLYLASNLTGEKRYSEARTIIRNLLAIYPYYPKARILLAICSFELGDSTAAVQDITDELRIETTPQAVHYAAYFAFRMNRVNDEYQYITILLNNSILSGSPELAGEAVRRLGQLCLIQGNAQECSQTVRSVREKFAGNAEMLEAVGDYYAHIGSFSEARSAFAAASSLQPLNDGIREKLRLVEDGLKKAPDGS
jgi:tetratricopeptide (TPR) repeat protein